MKKVLAILLAFTLLLVPFSTFVYAEAESYTDVTLTSTEGWSTSNDGNNWVLYLNTSGYTSTDWSHKYKGFTIDVDGVQGTTAQVSSAENNRLYCTIPTSLVPTTDGTVFTIKAGKYEPDDAGTVGLNITQDFDIVVSEGRLVNTQIIDPVKVEPVINDRANEIYFYLRDVNGNLITTGVESDTNFLSPSWCDFTRITQDKVPNQWSTVYSGVFVDGQPINYWGGNFKNHEPGTFLISGLSAVAGTKVTVRGHFVTSTQADWIVVDSFYIKEINFIFDGSTWSVGKEIVYTDYEGTPELVEFDRNIGIYFAAGETEFPYDAVDWTVQANAVDEEESGIFLNGEKTDAFIKKVDENKWYICLSDAGITLEDGDEVTIAGTFICETHRITFEETTFTYEEQQTNTYTGTPVLSEIEKYGKASGFYFTSEDDAPYDLDWNLTYSPADGEADGVFVNGTKTAITLKKVNTNLWYACISDAGVTLNLGDVVTIKGNFVKEDNIVTFNEASFEFNGRRFGEGEFTATDFTITGLAYSDIVYDETNSRWNMYFTLSTNLPGDVDSTYYPYMVYDINGTEYEAHWFKSSSAHTVNGETIYYLYIPMTELPADLTEEYVITIKSGASQGRHTGTNAARADGIRLTDDFEFTVGNKYSATAPIIDYTISNGGTENGIYLSSNDSFPTIGWDYSLTKADENSGVYVNGENTEVFIKKYADGKYYVCLSDLGITATEGTIVTLKGTFTTKNLNFVTFQTEKYIYSGGQWKVHSNIVEIPSTGVTGDGNGDGQFNILDYISVVKYVASDTDTIGLTDADLNGDGKINTADIILVKKLLLGVITYANGANITGAPTYSNTDEMRLAAYVSPTVDGFADYKDAGFTTLIGEQRAEYDVDGLDEYMNSAAEYGLDVLVQSGYLQSMLIGKSSLDANWLTTMYTDLSKYDNFRGLFMGDEPRIAYLESYTSVTNILKSLDPHMDLFTSCLPSYTNTEYLSTDTSLSLAEMYSNYANAYGNLLGEFTYDFYPFRHSYKSFLGVKYNEKDYMRDDWFRNLTLVAANAKGKYNTGITVQSYSENLVATDHYREVTQADISFQVYSALAYGMKSINYFTYGEHWDSSVGTTSCMIYNGEKTDTYYAVQNVNNEIKAFDNVLLNFNWQGTVGITGTNSNGIMDYVDEYTSKRISDYSANNDAIIGCLKDKNGYDGFMLVNATDPSANFTETISVTFNNADHAKVYVNGEESIVELTNGTYETTLTPGQGIFVIPYIA